MWLRGGQLLNHVISRMIQLQQLDVLWQILETSQIKID